jgi:hypothetical protein
MLETVMALPDLASASLQSFAQWNPPQQTFYLVSMLSALAAWLISRIADAPPMITVPAGYIILFSAGLFANFQAEDVFLSNTSEVVKLVSFTVAAHCFSALMLLAVFRAGDLRRV